MLRLLTCLLIAVLGVEYSTACDGYKVRIKKITNCNEKNVITIDSNFTTSITSDCILSNSGCYTSLGFKTAKVNFILSKNNLPVLHDEADICHNHNPSNEDVVRRLALLGFPTECPLPAGRQCVDPNKKLDITKFKKFLVMAKGNLELQTDVVHDTGVSCIKIKVDVSKK